MKAAIEDRLSTMPPKTHQSSSGTKWQEIAKGIYFGGLALALTVGIIGGIFSMIEVKLLNVSLNSDLKKLEYFKSTPPIEDRRTEVTNPPNIEWTMQHNQRQ
ncbi:MAG: hypothetical protein JWM78_463 [Verrucomicrobiaceae bacterium]|nr:hypothetical protein [Verrucomicrobiaceae bacterium]